MFQRVIVPVDGSDFSWRALGPAIALARQTDAPIEVLQVVSLPDDADLAGELVRDVLTRRASELGDVPVEVSIAVMGDTVATTIARHVEAAEGSITVMSSVGRGRSAALIGSIAEELLGELFGPIVVVGPDADVDRADFRGDLVVPVDGSETSEAALPLAAAWGITLEARPWIVTVVEPGAGGGDVSDSSYPARLARALGHQSHHEIEFEVLHGRSPEREVTDFARSNGASLIVASTHGRTGLARIRAGSVAMGIVRHASCPVVLQRPPHLRN